MDITKTRQLSKPTCATIKVVGGGFSRRDIFFSGGRCLATVGSLSHAVTHNRFTHDLDQIRTRRRPNPPDLKNLIEVHLYRAATILDFICTRSVGVIDTL